jgi:precorrin-2 dehydrogenase/sirohydrochlorin ferrochelatase/precorrin-6A/cobalt-precorrin-6A reductase
MENKGVLVIGAGKVAERRIRHLARFRGDITVISPEASPYIKAAAEQGKLQLLERAYRKGDVESMRPFLLITVAGDRQANHEAAQEAKRLDILASVADRREECTCYFPAIAESESFVAGLVSKDGDHTGVRRMAEKIRGILGE